MTLVLLIITLISVGFAVFFGYRLYQWEGILLRSRVKVYFKGKPSMTPRLIDFVHWIRALDGDKNVNGQVIYKQGGTTIAITKAHKRVGKAKDTIVKEGEKTWLQRRRDGLRRGSHPSREGHWRESPESKNRRSTSSSAKQSESTSAKKS